MENKEIFNDVLDEGEQIIAVMKPNKRKYWAFFNWMVFWAVGSWLPIVMIVVPFGVIFGEGVRGMSAFWIIFGVELICVFSWVITYIISRIFANLAYDKRFYAYSNKRILIRCGIIGVDYRVLDYKLLGATTVCVGVLDRMQGGKTGYLRFGSASSPILGGGAAMSGFGSSGYIFAHVDKPYDLLREIKKIMNTSEDEKETKKK
jgi:membrane protein YdbS with pleckstrin-like domain